MTNATMFENYIKAGQSTSLLLLGKEGFPLYQDAAKVCAALLGVEPERMSRHPDFLLVKTEKSMLTVDDALSLIDKAERLPAKATRIICLVDGFDKFNSAAQNKLLKLLEEVESFTMVATAYSKNVLPTILSRVQIVEYKPLSYPAYVRAMEEQGKEADEVKFCATGGVPCEPEDDLLCYFTKVKEAVEQKNKQELFKALRLVSEKDNANFFAVYGEKVPSMLSFIGRLMGESALKYVAGLEINANFTKDDFFLAIAQLAKGL